ncbi:hypothetical protein D3C71_1428410 [compost metagenome]
MTISEAVQNGEEQREVKHTPFLVRANPARDEFRVAVEVLPECVHAEQVLQIADVGRLHQLGRIDAGAIGSRVVEPALNRTEDCRFRRRYVEVDIVKSGQIVIFHIILSPLCVVAVD